jgi:geranylgeranyl pyrophosphate synthase
MRWRASIDAELAHIADRHPELPAALRRAIRYAVTGEGKRLRGLLVMAAYDAVGGRNDAGPLGASVEVVHAYSLAHDDLPCMDNAELRRGRPSVHRAHGVATTTVAGVAMVPVAVDAAVCGARRLELSDAVIARIVAALMRASGATGMVGGQLRDLDGEGRALSLAELERLHREKTGALITASLAIGGMAAGARDEQLSALIDVGDALGLAFQIADDILDATESSESLGKAAGHDVALAKSTYATLLGVAEARTRVDSLVKGALDTLKATSLATPPMLHLAHFVGARRS